MLHASPIRHVILEVCVKVLFTALCPIHDPILEKLLYTLTIMSEHDTGFRYLVSFKCGLKRQLRSNGHGEVLLVILNPVVWFYLFHKWHLLVRTPTSSLQVLNLCSSETIRPSISITKLMNPMLQNPSWRDDDSQPKFSACYVNWRFITAFKIARCWVNIS